MKSIPLSSHKPFYLIIVLLLIVVTGFSLRAWRIDSAPKGALIDELHFGYLTYSLLETGTDEHGQAWPVIFRGFGDQKLPAYAYALLPVVKLLGLQVLALRIPSLIAGTAIIIGMFWLLKELQLGWKWSLWGAFVTAVIPWSFFLSRIGFESNLALFFFVFGLASVLRGVRHAKLSYLAVGSVLLALCWYSYIAYRPVTVALIVVLPFMYKLSRRMLLTILISFSVVCLPLLMPSVIGANSARFNQVGITHDPGLALEINEQRTFCSMRLPTILCYSVFNKPMLIGQILAARTLRTFSPQYLATEGEDETFLTVAHFGQLYTSLYMFFAIGVGALLFTNLIPSRHARFILAGLLISMVPGVLAGEPQKVRLSPLLPFVVVATTVGTAQVFQFIKGYLRPNWRKLVSPLAMAALIGAVSIQTLSYVTSFVGVHSIQRENEYQSYLPDLYSYLRTLPADSLVVIKPFYSDPLMFYAFYDKIDPRWYQQNAVLGPLESSGFQHTVELGNVWAYDYSLSTVRCKAIERGAHGYLVTNEELPIAPIYQGKSTNGVHTYVYVYDSADVAAADCDFETTPLTWAK